MPTPRRKNETVKECIKRNYKTLRKEGKSKDKAQSIASAICHSK